MVTRDPLAVCRTLVDALAAGAATKDLDLDAFMAQAMDYDDPGTGLDRISRLLGDLNITHPMPVRRVRELMRWVREGDYDRIVDGEYLRRGEEPPLREEADAAGAHYATHWGAFRDAGGSVAEAPGRQLGEWLERRRGRPSRELGGALQQRHALDVRRLREHVHRAHARQAVAELGELGGVEKRSVVGLQEM